MLQAAVVITMALACNSLHAQSGRQTIERKMDEYRKAYSDIEFILLYQLADYQQLLPLDESLGASLSNVDYEHPESARMTLVESQAYRIALMLNNGMGSSTLFRTPDALIASKPYACLITWPNALFDEDPLAATRFIYNLDEDVIRKIPDSRRIDNHEFVEFSIDHEVFHCIDAYMNGPMFPRTSDPIRACCDRARSELRADTFAAMSHLSRYPSGKEFLVNLGNARTLNLLDLDVEHYTANMLKELVELSEVEATLDIRARVKKSLKVASQLAPSYESHRQFLATVLAALNELGVDENNLADEYEDLAYEKLNRDEVKALCDRIMQSHSAVHGPH
jgi:hypothetical protein